ncbi:MAG TPA: ribosome biogenesis GTPase Der [Planctomycetota bacterium]
MSLPRVAIVGRPNVGKSTLFNRLTGSRIAIVEPTPGVTRDRVSAVARLSGDEGERAVELSDTGGIGVVDRDDLGPAVEREITRALERSDLVLFVVDARAGLTPPDMEVAARLRKLGRPVVLVCNKVEGERLAWEVDAFRRLGLGGEPLAISAQNGEGMAALCDEVLRRLPPPAPDEAAPRPTFKLAIVGRRNAGKSTLVNALAGEERVIVSEVPGTTRDALDVTIEREGECFTLIDTAGVRKRTKHEDAIEFFSFARSYRAMRRADVVVLLFDATERISAVEKRLARYIHDHYRVVILGANKWDLVRAGLEPEDFRAYLDQELPGLAFAPIAFLSAKTGLNVDGILALARELHQRAGARIPTGELNRVLARAVESRSPGSRGQRVKIHYATQAETLPPTFVLFVNDARLIGKDYLRYLENRLRELTPLAEVPLRFVVRDKDNAAVPDSR